MYEYYLNNHHYIHSQILRYIYTWYGIRLEYDNPPNVFSLGLDVVRIGPIMVSSKARYRKNCMIYQNVTIGEESCALQIGDYVCVLPDSKFLMISHRK